MGTKIFSWRAAQLLGSLVFFLTLAACGGGTSGTATPTPTPSPVATNLTTYTGDGYQIGYPQSWKVNQGSAGLVTFSDPQGIAYMAIHVAPNPNGTIPATSQVDLGLQAFKSQATNYQKLDIAATTSVGGDTWSQGAATGDVKPAGQPSPVPAKIIVIADNHPANDLSTRSFSIGYATGQQVFDLANTGYFQPMLQSFKFV